MSKTAPRAAHAPAYLQPDFAQSPDFSRPMDLLTEDAKHSGSLVYRYRDDQTTVTVPNIPANQPLETRRAYLAWTRDQRIHGFAAQVQTKATMASEQWGRLERDHRSALEKLNIEIDAMDLKLAEHQGSHVCF